MPMIVARGASALVCGLLCCAVLNACASNPAERRLLSEHAEWRVWASGEFSRAGSLLDDAVVLFSVEHSGQQFAAGELYRAGGNDTPYDRQFSKYDWVAPKALRLFTPPTRQPRLTIVQIENASQFNVRWLLIQASENILALDLEPGDSIEVPLMQMSDIHRFTVTGQFADGAGFADRHSPNVPSDATLTLRVAASGSTVEDR